jgi:hypothetical protein
MLLRAQARAEQTLLATIAWPEGSYELDRGVLNSGWAGTHDRAYRPLRGLYTQHFTCCDKLLIRHWGRHTTNNPLTHTVVHQLRTTSTNEPKLVVMNRGTCDWPCSGIAVLSSTTLPST